MKRESLRNTVLNHTTLGYVSHHHLITELVIEGVGEEARDGGEPVHHVEREAAVVAQHHQQGAHVGVDLIHLDGRPFQELCGFL